MFQDIVGMEDLKRTVRLKIIEPFLNPQLFQQFKKTSGGAILLYGPPGCGKTMLAKAIANEIKAEFVSVGISDVLNMYVGQSERNLKEVFDTARANRPAVLFFDELDALAISRSKSHSDHSRTLVNEFLSQLDGLGNDNDGILLIGATNMPWDVDSAAKRPGRFSRQIFVPPPDAVARASIFKKSLSELPCEHVDFELLANSSNLFTGADIAGVIDTAKESVLSEIIESGSHRPIRQADITAGMKLHSSTCIEWLKTARNLVLFGGADKAYKDVADFLKLNNMS